MTGVSHNTVIHWVKSAGHHLSSEPDHEKISEVAQIDPLQTYADKKQDMSPDDRQQESARNFSLGNWRP